jgi:hypothetical protein
MFKRLAFAAFCAIILPALPAAACNGGCNTSCYSAPCGGAGYGYAYPAQPAPVVFAPVPQAQTYYAAPQYSYGYYPPVAQTAYPAYGYYGYAPRPRYARGYYGPRRYASAYYGPRRAAHYRPYAKPRYTK